MVSGRKLNVVSIFGRSFLKLFVLDIYMEITDEKTIQIYGTTNVGKIDFFCYSSKTKNRRNLKFSLNTKKSCFHYKALERMKILFVNSL